MGVKRILQDADYARQRTANVRWVLAHQQDLWDNYPNRWIFVDGEKLQMVGVEFFPTFQTIHQRQVITPSSIIYYSAKYDVPIMLTWMDISKLIKMDARKEELDS